MSLFAYDEDKASQPSVDLKEVKEKLKKASIYACDLETTGLELAEDRITIVALAAEIDGKTEGWAIDTSEYPIETIRKELMDIFHDESKTAVFHNCFHYQTQVLLEDGSYKSIGEIVNKKLPVKVMSWDGKKLVPKRIINYWHNGRRNNWYKLVTEDKPNQSHVYVTGDHKVYKADGTKVSVNQLKVDDYLQLSEKELSPSQKQLVLGSYLGDGSIIRTKSSSGAYFTCSHGEAQESYLRWKANSLAGFGGCKVRSYSNNRGFSRKDGVAYNFRTANSMQFLELKNMSFDGNKRISEDILNALDERGLAVWYMDDGGYNGDERKKIRNTGSVNLNLYSFNSEDVDLLQKWLLAKFKLKFSKYEIRETKRGFVGYRLSASGQNARNFSKLVAPYIHPNLNYKLPCAERGKYRNWIRKSNTLCKTKIIELKKLNKNNWPKVLKNNRVGYDLEVEDTHNYFAGNLLVSNCNFDIKFLNKYGIYLHNKIADTMIMAWLNDEDRIRHSLGKDGKSGGKRGYGLKWCVLKHLNYKMSSYEEARSLFGDFDDYAADDAVQTLKLFFTFRDKLRKLKLMDWFWQVEMPIVKCLIEAETRGVMLDKSQLKKIKKEAWVRVEELEDKIYKKVGYKFDIGSPAQWAQILFEEMQIGMTSEGSNEFSTKGKSGQWSTSNAVLKAMAQKGHEIAKLLLDFREINTRLNVFIRPLLERCRTNPVIHPRFIVTGTVSGRFASRNPNYQNLPRKGGVRKAFVARPGYKIVKADYAQAELRLMAHMSGDPVMMGIYQNNGDIHQTTADACSVSRQAAKAINFGLIYRMSAKRLQAQLAFQGIEFELDECYKFVKRYFRKYGKVKSYHKRVEHTVMDRLAKNGQFGWVRTLGGRYRRLDSHMLTSDEYGYTTVTKAINTTIQGGVSDMIKIAMVDTQNTFYKNDWLDPENDIWDACIQGQVHDEIFVECKEEIAEDVSKVISYHMENAGRKFKIKVPMTAEAEIVDSLAK